MSELPPYIYGREAGQNEKVWTEAEVRMLARERDMLSARVLDMLGAAAQAAQPEADERSERDPFEKAIDSFIEDYEMIGETEDGRGACYTLNDNERALIKDAIMGLLGDTEWDRLWGAHIDSLVQARAPTAPAQAEPVAYWFQKHNCFGQLVWDIAFSAPRDATQVVPLYATPPSAAAQPEAVGAAIPLNPAEIQSNHSRVNWAEGLIRQLPEDHDGRNSWLLNYGNAPRPKDYASAPTPEPMSAPTAPAQAEPIGTIVHLNMPPGPPHWSEKRIEVALNDDCKMPDGAPVYATPPATAAGPSDAEWKVGPLTDELALILGRPNFTCIRYAEMLRELGQEIRRKSEFEQAAVIHWMLGFYATHGDKWAEAASESMDARLTAIRATKGGKL